VYLWLGNRGCISGDMLEKTTCSLCGSDRSEVRWLVHDWVHGHPGDFTLDRCMNCGLLYLNPRPTLEEIGTYYPRNYAPFRLAERAASSKLWGWIYRAKLRPRIRVVERYAQGGSLLDVGCAGGAFLAALDHRRGWHLQGVELDADSATFARDRLGLDVFSGTLEEAAFPENTFDVITLWDVLEHFHDPRASLDEIFRVLKPGGVVIVSTPNEKSLDARLFGRYWIGLDAPRHLHVFSTETLSDIVARVGFVTEDLFCFYGRYTTFALSLSVLFNAHVASNRLQHLWRRIVLFPVFRYLTLPYFWIVDKMRLGAIVTLIGRKPVSYV
jgi:SAM-dependent methyltransferase